LLVPVAIDTRQSQDGTVKKGLHRPRLSAIIISSRPPALILIAAPFSSRLSRYTIAQRAAKLVFATLKYRQSLLDNSLEKETSGGTVIENDRNHHLFGRVANIRKAGLKWNKDIKHCKSSTHIVVAVDGAFYKLDVIDGSGAVIAAENILHDINSIIHAAAGDKNPSKPYGVITANIARPSADIFYADRLDESIEIIDEAIFLLAIDNIGFPADENEAAQDLHIRNHHNRDYRKSLQLVVLESGFSGATFSLFTEIEGVLAVKFAAWINSYAKNIPELIAAKNQDSFSKLEFETIDFGQLPLAKLKDGIAKHSCNLPLIKKIDAIGKDGIKQLNVSPDAFFHAAAHLAYYEKFKRIPSIHSLVDMRGIKFGSITRYLSTTDELAEFLENQTKSALLNAFDAHKRKVGVIKSGDNPVHYAYYYLFATVALKSVLGVILFRLFVPDLFTKHVSPDIWASNIPALSGIYFVGRFGTLFKAARKNCLAGHYLLFPDHIKICFLSNERSFLESWQFDQALEDAMIKLKQILS
jgi:Choline/Carnitine o-acyltransferase